MRTRFHLPQPIKTACASIREALVTLPSLTSGIRSKFNDWRRKAQEAGAAIPGDFQPHHHEDAVANVRANFHSLKSSLEQEAHTHERATVARLSPWEQAIATSNEKLTAGTELDKKWANQQQQMMENLYGGGRYARGLNEFFNQDKK